MKDVKELLRKHDYVTVIQKAGDGCIVTYPHPKLIRDSPRLVESFSFQRGENPGMVVSTSYDSQDQTERFIPVPEYALRLYIISEAIACNMGIPISSDLIVYVDEKDNEHENLGDVIQEPVGEGEKDKEDALIKLINEAGSDGFSAKYEEVAKTKDIVEGYGIIRKFYGQL